MPAPSCRPPAWTQGECEKARRQEPAYSVHPVYWPRVGHNIENVWNRGLKFLKLLALPSGIEPLSPP